MLYKLILNQNVQLNNLLVAPVGAIFFPLAPLSDKHEMRSKLLDQNEPEWMNGVSSLNSHWTVPP